MPVQLLRGSLTLENIYHKVMKKTKLFPNSLTVIDMYKASDKLCQTIILSILDKPKKEIMQLFDCTKYKIDQARPLKKQFDSLNIPKVVKHNRQRRDQLKCEHFLDFIFTGGILMDVTFCATNIFKYDSGETQTLSHAVLIVRFKLVHILKCVKVLNSSCLVRVRYMEF